MVKAILFDFDGVIAHTEPLHLKTFREVVGQFGIEISEERWYNKFTGIGSQNIMENLFEENGIKEDVGPFVDKRNKLFIDYIENHEVKIVPGIIEFVKKVKKMGLRRAIVSGSRSNVVKTVSKKMGILEDFEVFVTAESVKNKKPDPEGFLKAAKLLNTEPKDCLILEDSISGITAAKRTGIPYICIKSPGTVQLKECSILIKDYYEFPMEILNP